MRWSFLAHRCLDRYLVKVARCLGPRKTFFSCSFCSCYVCSFVVIATEEGPSEAKAFATLTICILYHTLAILTNSVALYISLGRPVLEQSQRSAKGKVRGSSKASLKAGIYPIHMSIHCTYYLPLVHTNTMTPGRAKVYTIHILQQ